MGMQRRSAYLKLLTQAICDRHGLAAVHVQTVFVSLLDASNGRIQSDVEVFALMTASEARKCFAWTSKDGQPVILLATTEVHSPEQALRSISAPAPIS